MSLQLSGEVAILFPSVKIFPAYNLTYYYNTMNPNWVVIALSGPTTIHAQCKFCGLQTLCLTAHALRRPLLFKKMKEASKMAAMATKHVANK